MNESRTALISIKPPYAEAILTGRKSVELRRRIPSVTPGTRLFIYSTLPVGAVVGTVTIEGVARGTPSTIWDEYGSKAAVRRSEFDAYFDGTDRAVGLLLKSPRRVRRIGIAVLRSLRAGFHPPQVMLHLSEDEAAALEIAAGCENSLAVARG